MFIIFLRFASHRERASAFMEAHKAWLDQGVDEGAFLLAGSLGGNAGGAIVAHGLTRDELEHRLSLDPFVRHQIVAAEVTEVKPSRVNDRFRFVMGGA